MHPFVDAMVGTIVTFPGVNHNRVTRRGRVSRPISVLAGFLAAALVLAISWYGKASSLFTPLESSNANRSLNESPLTIEATGRNFVWHFRLPGPDGMFGTQDDLPVGESLHLPLDRDVTFLLKSEDFVYVFSVPQLKLREIAVPEMTFRLAFRTTSSGSVDVVADPLCGVRLFHDRNMGRITIEPQHDFREWFKAMDRRPKP